MLRRKLKNRVAAQTARDRKKQRMSELEEQLAAIEAENQRLLAENATLKQSSSTLSRENLQLKQRLQTPPAAPALVVETERKSEPESAVLESPQQKELARTFASLTTAQCFGAAFFLASLMHCLNFLTSSTRPCVPSLTTTTIKKEVQHTSTQTFKEESPDLPPWWGAHQRNWTPSMRS
jgi:X box-binding protein 1